MHVAVVEPGAVSTPIWRKGRGEYDVAMAAMPERARELYGARLARIPDVLRRQDAAGVPPEEVADAVAHALSAPRPRAVYTVGRDARVLKTLHALLPAPAFDVLMGRLSGLG
jgi:NAD(P)-dependent dehydrogenase (short-subunit alcohol dehydrogenase family)